MGRLADLLRAEVAERGWKQADLARRMGRSPQYVVDILKGKKCMDAPLAIALEVVLERPAADFLLAALEDARESTRSQASLQRAAQGIQQVQQRMQEKEVRGKVARLRRSVRLDQLSPEHLERIARIVDEVESSPYP